MNNSGAAREKVFAEVCRLVPEKHVNTGLLGANWEELVAQRAEEILKSADTEQFEKRVRSLLAGLRTSHTGFHHTSTRSVPAAHAINATLKSYSVAGELTWVFQDVHEGGAAYATGIRPGDLLLAIDESRVIPPTTPLFRPGESRTVTVQHPNGLANRIQMGVAIPKTASTRSTFLGPLRT